MEGERRFIKIAVTPAEPVADEGAKITAMLDGHGWDAVHLRHPGVTDDVVRNIIASVPARLHDRLHLHDNFGLAAEFAVGGLHLNRRCPAPPAGYTGRLSRSCHSVDEVEAARAARIFDYVTLSPVFDSISKRGYRGAFTPGELRLLDSLGGFKVIALGGVTPERIELLKQYNFAGVAMLGAVGWENMIR